MITIRKLEEKDAPLMLEWMHDPDVQKGFKKNMLDASIDDALNFCRTAMIPDNLVGGEDLHFAIVNETDEYLGTISLKNIDLDNMSAEYAITTRPKIQGRGVATKATRLILDKAFNEYGLHRVYLNVFADNEAAIRLYERCGFTFEGEFRQHLKIGENYKNWKWFGILEHEFRAINYEKGAKSHGQDNA